ncbi:MAG: Crp/Fnr family transcriptional regulator [Erysipelotrichales bacterium]
MKLLENIQNKEEILTQFNKIEVKKKQTIFYEKEECFDFYYLIKGKVTLQSTSPQGKKKIFFTMDDDNIVNDVDLKYNRFPYEAIAFEDCTLLKINQLKLEKLCNDNIQLYKNLLSLQSHRSRRLYRQLKNSVSINVEKKLAAKLWKLAKDYGFREEDYILIDFKVNNTYLAEVIGCSRESVSRAIQTLIKIDLVKIEKNKYYVKQEELVDYYRE